MWHVRVARRTEGGMNRVFVGIVQQRDNSCFYRISDTF